MKKAAFALLVGAGLTGALAAPAAAQSGFALKGHYIVNATSAQAAREDRQIPDANAFGIGAELVLPFGLGVGVSGYTADEVSELDAKTTELTVLGEANYFVKIPLFPVSPYVGVHAGLGRLSGDNITDPGLEIQDKTRSQIGYQLGVRLQATSLIGIDAQWRHMSTSAASEQDESLERNQVLLGITLF
jgi:opacity protein-like surface antigen